LRTLTMMLNAPFSGPQAWLLLALRRGYLADAGIDLRMIPGTGAYNAAPRHVAERCDLSYGDIYSLAEVWSADPATAPVCMYAVFRRSAAAIAVRADGPLQNPGDLASRSLVGHGSDVGLRTFPAYAAASGTPLATVSISLVESGMAEIAGSLASVGGPDGFFGYISTITAALAAESQNAGDVLRWMRFSDILPDFYGSGLIVSRSLAAQEPQLCRAFVAAVHRGLREAARDVAAGIDAVLAFSPQAIRRVEEVRWRTTLMEEMTPLPGDSMPFGTMDQDRLGRSLAAHGRSLGLDRIPGAGDIFTDAFLPLPDQRFSAEVFQSWEAE
jgi:NitT/TauT family transport system substrate-binding protein